VSILGRSFPTDRVRLEKANGEVIEGVVALVQPESVLVEGGKIPFEEGDTIVRTLSNGIVERYLITGATFYGNMPGIGAHHQLKVRKASAIPPLSQGPSITYNVSGPHARVNVGSHDASTNITVTADELFANMAAAAQTIQDPTKQQDLLAAIEQMKATTGSTASFKDSYLRFMAVAADHLGVFLPFLAALSGFLR